MDGLILGWRVTPTLEPRYWLDIGARPGSQPNTELVAVPGSAFGTHCVIIAQSGSGKSLFLGRIVEEVLLRTKARCLILDPNADFRSVDTVENSELWENAKYDSVARCGKLPHEDCREKFCKEWARINIRILASKSVFPTSVSLGEVKHLREPLVLWWPSLSSEFLSEDIDPKQRIELYHCHSFVQAIGHLLELKHLKTQEKTDPIDKAQELYRIWIQDKTLMIRRLLKEFPRSPEEEIEGARFGIDALCEVLPLLSVGLANGLGLPWISVAVSVIGEKVSKKATDFSDMLRRTRARRQIESWFDRACTALDYVSPEIGRFYFGKAMEYKVAGILTPHIRTNGIESERLKVIDLASLPDRSARLLAIDAILKEEWNQAKAAWERAIEKPKTEDDRVPTFIVLDEAHNYVPANTRGAAEAALREQFRTIAAEGRKYGLFLVMVSQRPDKLDPFIVSECENKALMRLDSESVLKVTLKTLGLKNVHGTLARKSLECGIGRALLTGRWAPEGPQWLYCATRRTIEGGRSLRPEHWAVP